MSDSNTTPLTLLDIRKGSTLNYELKNWKAIGEYNYRWPDGRFSREFKLVCASSIRYLEIEDQEEDFRIRVSRKVGRNNEISRVLEAINKNNTLPKSIHYSGKNLNLKEATTGEYRDRSGYSAWERFEVWDYYDSTQKHMLSIERWEEEGFKAYFGKVEQKTAFSNITKPPPISKSAKALGWFARFGAVFVFLAILLSQFLFFSRTTNTSYGNDVPFYEAEWKSYTPEKEGLDELLESYADYPTYSVLLVDMLVDKNPIGYYHKYEVVFEREDSIQTEITLWKAVSSQFFKAHTREMGLEIATKTDGIIEVQSVPPGFSLFIGNPKYGAWLDDGYNRREWIFSDKYDYAKELFYHAFARPYIEEWELTKSVDAQARAELMREQYNTAIYVRSPRGVDSDWARYLLLKQEEEEKRARARTTRSSNRVTGVSSRSRGSSGGGGK